MPATEVIKAIVCNKTDTLDNWNSANPILLKGQIAIVKDGFKRRMKVGDGANAFTNLPYIDDFLTSYSINKAVPTTNPGAPSGGRIWEASQSGTYTNFLDANNSPIVVDAGEFVHIVDNGTSYEKVVVPFDYTGYATDEQLQAVWDASFPQAPTRPAATHYIFAGSKFFPDPVVTVDDYYVDMKQSFILNRLHSVSCYSGVTGDVTCHVVTISASNVLTIIASLTNSTIIGQNTAVDFYSAIETYAALGNDTNVRAFIAVTNGTNQPISIDSTITGNQVWQFDETTRALSAKLLDTDIFYSVMLFDEPGLQKQLSKDQPFDVVKLTASATLTEANSVVLVDTTALSAAADVRLPRYGIPKGKVFTVKRIGGATYGVNLIPQDSSKIETGSSFVLSALYASQRVIFDGVDYWKI